MGTVILLIICRFGYHIFNVIPTTFQAVAWYDWCAQVASCQLAIRQTVLTHYIPSFKPLEFLPLFSGLYINSFKVFIFALLFGYQINIPSRYSTKVKYARKYKPIIIDLLILLLSYEIDVRLWVNGRFFRSCFGITMDNIKL